MRSYTKIIASKRLQRDCMFLNGKEEDVTKSNRITTVIKQLRALAKDRTYRSGAAAVHVKAAEWAEYRLKIVSDNNFPTAAGLASSASGFACLTK
jgi:diphosphomevalonate decarboxylase